MSSDNHRYPLSLMEFIRMFSTDEACIRYLIASRWPNGFQCPSCKAKEYWYRADREILVCKACRRDVSPTAGTLLHRSHVSIKQWFWASYLVSTLTPGISAHQFQRQLEIGSYRTAWYMLHRLRAGMVDPKRKKLSGIVEADETFIGGPAKKARGRGVIRESHVSLVIGAVEVIEYADNGSIEERAGRLRLEVAPAASEANIRAFLNDNVEYGSSIRTDGWKGYSKTAMEGFEHAARIQRHPKRASKQAPHIHCAFGNLKTWLCGTHHGVDPKYLPRYLDEYVFRHNRRDTPMAAFATLLGLVENEPPISRKNIMRDQ